MTEDEHQYWAVANTVMDIRVLEMAVKFFSR